MTSQDTFAQVPDASAGAEPAEYAVVLSGGGPVGYGWTVGLLTELLEQGVNLRRAGLIVGTSAGAIAGAYLALGLDPTADLSASKLSSAADIYRPQEESGGPDLLAEFAAAARATDPDQARAAIGTNALAARTIGEDAYIARSPYSALAGRPWPKAFRATTVNATTGRLAVWSNDSGVDLAAAVAASSSVPGITPAVTLNGECYIDGGVYSTLNADLAGDAQHVIVVSCLALATPENADANITYLYENLARELDTIRAAGGSIEVIEPSAEFLELSGHGTRLLDVGLIPAAVQVGRSQAKIEAPRLAAWNQV